MMMRDFLKFKKLLNEFRSLKFEGEYIEDILSEAHLEFDEFYSKFCEENSINIEELENKNKERVETIKEESSKEYFKKEDCDSKEFTPFKKTHRKLVRLLHPDKLKPEDPRSAQREEDFKIMSDAIQRGLWATFFDIADKYGVEIEEVEEANRLLVDEIKKMEGKIKGKKSTFSWMLNQCENDPCRERVIRAFLSLMYGYSE